MIYTVTFNPALDYVVKLDCLKSGLVNRTKSEQLFAGGKGINVSAILAQLEIPSTALGFTAGFTGDFIESSLKSQNINTDFVKLPTGSSRINVKIKSPQETEINAAGPDIPDKCTDLLFRKLDKLKADDFLVLAGSIPPSLPNNMYERIMKRLDGKNIKFVIDASNQLLFKTIKYKPFLVKPNNFELAEIFNTEINSVEDALFYAEKLHEMGAVNVLVSMAENGSVLLDENGKTHIMGIPQGEVINSVGAGDSMLAGFIAGYIKTTDYSYALKLGTAAGSATVFSEGLADKKLILELFDALKTFPTQTV